MAWFGTQYALTATAVTLSSVLGARRVCYQLDIKNATAAANTVYLGPSNVTAAPANARVELSAGQSYSFVVESRHSIDTDEIYIIGTVNAANIAFISLVQ